MSEMDAFQQAYDKLPPEEKQRVAIQMFLNRAQQDLIAPPMQQQYQRTPYQRPENLGQGLNNIGSNLVGNLLRGIGASPSYREVTANIAQEEHRRDVSQAQADFARDMIGRNWLKQSMPGNADAIDALSSEEISNVITNRHGQVQYDEYGNPYQVNLLTGQRTNIYQLPAPLQEWHIANSQNQNRLNQDQQVIATDAAPESRKLAKPNLPELSFPEYVRRNKYAEQQGTDSQAVIKGWNDSYAEAAYGATEQIKRLNDMQDLLKNGLETGQLAQAKAYFEGLGYDLGIGDSAPTEAQLFRAVATSFVLPMAKQLGVNPTDKDMELIKESAVDLSKTTEGNFVLIETIKIEQERAQLVQNEYLRYQQENEENYKYDPTAFELGWRKRLNEITSSAAFKGEDMLKLRARARTILGKSVDGANAAEKFSTKGGGKLDD